MENHTPDQSVFEAMIEEIAGKSVGGKAFTISVKTLERKQCYEALKTAKVLSDVPQLPDPTTQGMVLRPAKIEAKMRAQAPPHCNPRYEKTTCDGVRANTELPHFRNMRVLFLWHHLFLAVQEAARSIRRCPP